MKEPTVTPVADRAVLVEFGSEITDETHAQVLRLDRLVASAPVLGLVEAVPAYTSLLVIFDPTLADHDQIAQTLRARLDGDDIAAESGRLHKVAVCYDSDLGTDLATVADQVGTSVQAVIAAHLAGVYRVCLYGFAPGYAYLAGTPAAIQVPRKAVAVRDVPAGRVIVTGPQCIVTTLQMPTGWSILGASPQRILRDDPVRPFLFDVGDMVQFHRIDRAGFHAAGGV
jgi:inhibitor of KinA